MTDRPDDAQRTFSFSTALRLLKEGARVARRSWAEGGGGPHVTFITPEANQQPGQYLAKVTGDCSSCWLPGNEALLADDWHQVAPSSAGCLDD